MGGIVKCLRIGCNNTFPKSEGRGRPQKYCRHACMIAAFRLRHDTNAERQADYRERRNKREYDERRARAKVYAAAIGDALKWDKERVEEALVRVASHEDGLVAAELALQSCARRSR